MTHDKPRAAEIGWRLKQTRSLFESRWFNLRQDLVALPGGEEITYSYVQHPGAVFVVPLTAEGNFILLRSYRYPIDEWCWEVPSGFLGHPGRAPEEVAREELLEEIGGQAAEMIDLGIYFMANGFASYKAHHFLAKGVTIGSSSHPEISEKIERIESCDLSRVIAMISNGEVNDGESAFALLRAVAYLGAAPGTAP